MKNIELSDKTKLALYAMIFKYKGLLITGSIGLKCLGVIDREIHDIDFCTYDNSEFEEIVKNEKQFITTENESVESDEEPNEEEPKTYVRLFINGVGVCIFNNSALEKSKTFDIKAGDMKLKCVHPKLSIDAKRKYVSDILKKDALSEYNIEKANQHLKDIYRFQYWNEPK